MGLQSKVVWELLVAFPPWAYLDCSFRFVGLSVRNQRGTIHSLRNYFASELHKAPTHPFRKYSMTQLLSEHDSSFLPLLVGPAYLESKPVWIAGTSHPYQISKSKAVSDGPRESHSLLCVARSRQNLTGAAWSDGCRPRGPLFLPNQTSLCKHCRACFQSAAERWSKTKWNSKSKHCSVVSGSFAVLMGDK